MAMGQGIKFKIKQMIKQAVQNVVLPAYYELYRRRPVDPRLIVFADAHHNQRPAAMELLYLELKKIGEYRIVEHYLDYGEAGALAVAKHSVRFMKLYAAAGCVVICDNFLPAASCRKKPETKVVQLWHACGCYKKFGYDAKDDIPKDYRGANVYRNANLVTVSGKAARRPFASAMRLPERCVQPLGVSRTDLYFDKGWRRQCEERFYRRYPEAAGKKVVLWAPTFRGNAGAPEMIAPDLEKLSRALGDEYMVLARVHPHMLSLIRSQGSGKSALEKFHCDIPTEELYPVTDVLIADYSSLIYEYLLFRRPLVLYVPDLQTYRAQRGFYMQIEEIPARMVTDEKMLADAVEASAGEGTHPGLDAFLSTYMGSCDGHATARIASRIWNRNSR